MEKNRSPYNTTLDNDLLKKLKFLSVEMNKRQNDLIEEAIQDLLKKYEPKAPGKKK
jgi:metal-responsive CopG/Arc/MetJ family transcriptional regulator